MNVEDLAFTVLKTFQGFLLTLKTLPNKISVQKNSELNFIT